MCTQQTDYRGNLYENVSDPKYKRALLKKSIFIRPKCGGVVYAVYTYIHIGRNEKKIKLNKNKFLIYFHSKLITFKSENISK